MATTTAQTLSNDGSLRTHSQGWWLPAGGNASSCARGMLLSLVLILSVPSPSFGVRSSMSNGVN